MLQCGTGLYRSYTGGASHKTSGVVRTEIQDIEVYATKASSPKRIQSQQAILLIRLYSLPITKILEEMFVVDRT